MSNAHGIGGAADRDWRRHGMKYWMPDADFLFGSDRGADVRRYAKRVDEYGHENLLLQNLRNIGPC